MKIETNCKTGNSFNHNRALGARIGRGLLATLGVLGLIPATSFALFHRAARFHRLQAT